MILLDAYNQKPTSHTPVWLMRQAGRYMKEYRELRQKVSFLELCKSPELVCETTLFACEKIHADAAIIFADILLITESLGFDLEFAKNHGPIIHNPYTPEHVFDSYHIKDDYDYLAQSIALTRKELPAHKALIGFAGAPFTVATYCIEGGKSKDFTKVKNLMADQSADFHRLMDKITQATITYLQLQIDAGADCIQLFDSWVGLLDQENYKTFALPYVHRIFSSLPDTVTIYFGTNTKHLLPTMKKAGANVLGLDSDVEIKEMWPQLDFCSIQGNLDPMVLMEDFSVIKKHVDTILAQVNRRPGFVFNLGHGIKPQTPVDNVTRLIDYVHEQTST